MGSRRGGSAKAKKRARQEEDAAQEAERAANAPAATEVVDLTAMDDDELTEPLQDSNTAPVAAEAPAETINPLSRMTVAELKKMKVGEIRALVDKCENLPPQGYYWQSCKKATLIEELVQWLKLDENPDAAPPPARPTAAAARKDDATPAAVPTAAPVTASGTAPVPARAAPVERFDEDLGTQAEDTEAEVERRVVCYGAFGAYIVGVQYYAGTVSRNEQVRLVREPTNPYDRNAIRVDNILDVKVGHLPRDKALYLAPLLDRELVHHISGVVTTGADNKYSIPVTLFLWGLPENKEEVVKRCRLGQLYLGGDVEPQARRVMELEPVTKVMDTSEREDALDQLFKRLEEERQSTKTATPNRAVTAPMYPHQKEALAWMLHRENSNSLPPFWSYEEKTGMYVNILSSHKTRARPAVCRGGILADDMGLGKTLQTIALICSNGPDATPPALEEAPRDDGSGEGQPQAKKPKGKVKGPAPNAPNAPKGKVKGPGKNAPKVLVSKQDAAGSTSSPPSATGPRTTLIVCPVSVLSNWEQQIAEHTDGSLSVYRYHGTAKTKKPNELTKHDVVITTYGTLTADKGAVLDKVNWLRVVLDEAHNIKNPNVGQSVATRKLTAERRWAITGTPIQNRLHDLYSLLAFLRVQPLDDRSFWTRVVDKPVHAGNPVGYDRLVTLMAAIALRRTKDQKLKDGTPLVRLPTKEVLVQTVEMGLGDRARYSNLLRAAQEQIGGMIADGSLFGNYAHALEVILRLRQLCCHGDLVKRGKNGEEKPVTPPTGEQMAQLMSVLRAGGLDDCCICLGSMFHPVVTRCAHVFCRGCIAPALERRQSCPLCRAACKPGELVEAPPDEDGETCDGAGATLVAPSAKTEALVARLKTDLRARVDGGGRKTKAVVFSQFVTFIDIAQKSVEAAGFKCVRLSGGVSAANREKRIDEFQSADPSSPDVIFVSLKAGGVGINLTAANFVYMLDPWWNPATEDQAMDRVHRLGQDRPVTVVRFVCKDTIDEKMMELQQRKRELAKAAFVKKTEKERQEMRKADLSLLLSLTSLV